MPVNIAIDGPSGAGKSTLAKAISARLGYIYVDTGAIYRCIGLFILEQGISPDDADCVVQVLPQIDISIAYEDGAQKMYLNGRDVTGLIRTPEVTSYASSVSAIAAVRTHLLEMQRSIARSNNCIMDGRDIGTVVLPDADIKIFLTATAEERAKRRRNDYIAKGVDISYEQVLSDMQERDKRDSSRDAAPLKAADDAVKIDSTALGFDETLDMLLRIIKEKTV